MHKSCPHCGHRFESQLAPGLKDACPQCMAEFLMGRTEDVPPPEGGAPARIGEPPLAPGDTIDQMELVGFLGQGGMGFVYEARQTSLERIVALKVLDPRLAASAEFTGRFTREAKALAALSHPHIVQVFDYGRDRGLYYLVMEYVEGTTLRQIMTAGQMTPEAALRYVPQICEALEYAHSRGIIHRDIKPENILVDTRGTLKIADFGLAKMANAAGRSTSQATETGRVMGTAHYMAPEQVRGIASVDHRADIYSLGVVFYEMLTGELPIGKFPAPSAQERVDARLDDVVLKTLETEPARRYQRASHVRDDVARITATEAIDRERHGLGARGWILAGALLAILALVLWGVLGGVGVDPLDIPEVRDRRFASPTTDGTATSVRTLTRSQPAWLARVGETSPAIYWALTIGLLAFAVVAPAFWLWMFVDCARRSAEDVRTFTRSGRDDKLIWIGLMIVLNVVGSLAYWLVVKRRARREAI
jgi:predicted Ser/Thr protein kinase